MRRRAPEVRDAGPLGSVLAELDRALRAHAGGIELVDHDENGVARVRYTGMCTGCPLKPLTTAATVRPALMEVGSVTAVEVEGSAISEQAERRLAKALSAHPALGRLSGSRNE